MASNASLTHKELWRLITSQDSFRSSIVLQRSTSGRFGRFLHGLKQRKIDSVLSSAVCSWNGIGRSRCQDQLVNLAKNNEGDSGRCTEDDEEQRKKAVVRAWSCLAEIKNSSADEATVEEGLKLLESSVNSGDAFGIFHLGMIHEWGLHGYQKNEKRAKELYDKCEATGFLDVALFLSSIGVKDTLKPETEEWYSLLCRVNSNTARMQALDLRGFF